MVPTATTAVTMRPTNYWRPSIASNDGLLTYSLAAALCRRLIELSSTPTPISQSKTHRVCPTKVSRPTATFVDTLYLQRLPKTCLQDSPHRARSCCDSWRSCLTYSLVSKVLYRIVSELLIPRRYLPSVVSVDGDPLKFTTSFSSWNVSVSVNAA